jgi:ComEC/Rec2-related protein
MTKVRSESFLFLFCGLVVGAWLAFSFGTLRMVFVIVATLIFGFLSFRKERPVFLLFLLGLLIGTLSLFLRFPVLEGENDYLGFVIASKGNYFIFWSKGARYYVYEKETEREVGDFLLIHGRGQPYEGTIYESRFDFGSYLSSLGVTESLKVSTIEVRFQMPLRLRSYERQYLQIFDAQTGSLIDSLLFSHKDYTQNYVQEASSLGCLYFLSASGILFSAFLRLVERLLLMRWNEKKSRLGSLLLGLPFLFFNFQKLGLWRVFLSRFLTIYFDKKGEKPSRIYVVSISGILLLGIDRYHALDQGFLLGYGFSLVMGLSQGLLLRYQSRKKKLVSRGLLLGFLLPVMTSGGGLHLLSLFYSFLLLPFALGFGSIAFFGFLTFRFFVPLRILQGFGTAIVWVVDACGKIDLVVPLGNFDEAFVFAFYLVYCVALWFSDCGFTRKRSLLFLSLALALGLNAVPFGNAFSQEIDFVNVGQGDCILVRDGYTTVMIDTGGNLSFDMAQEVDIPFLRKKRVYDIDCLIASHGDYDHIGGADSLKRHFKIRRYVDSREAFPLDFGSLHFVNYNVYNLTSENEQSLVLSLDFMGKSWLFGGDAPISLERKILSDHPEIDCDILKVGHHGSKTSSCSDWIATLSPEVAIISVGRHNPYGHPDEEVLERLESFGIAIRRTDLEGTIVYKGWRKTKQTNEIPVLEKRKHSCY